MKNTRAPGCNRFCLDARLIAAVQTRAGARCHESAGLINAYYLCAQCYGLSIQKGDAHCARDARQNLEEAETRLRRFLAACSPAPRPSFAYA